MGDGATTFIIETPENLPLEFVLAPLGSRLAAFVIDFLIMIGATVVLSLIAIWFLSALGLSSGAPFLTIVLLLHFLLWNGYFIYFETRWNGTTPGKRANDLRVIARDGGPLTSGAVLARNLLRELELYLPLQAMLMPSLLNDAGPGWAQLAASLWIFLFLFMPMFNREKARCGDLVAGTRVVLQPGVVLLPDPAIDTLPGKKKNDEFVFTPEQLQMYGIHELQVLEDLVREKLDQPQQEELLELVAQKITDKIAYGSAPPPHRVQDFLLAFYRAQRKHLEEKLLLGERRERKRVGRLKKKK
jgi:uncharacterized RDD family membrane protein YckC